MKKDLFAFCLVLFGFSLIAQTPRLSLYEEFTGETCPPCASTNPGLNVLLASPTNTPKIVAIKWQVPIPSAPSNTWSLYQTNKTEIDWRWTANGYGYNPAINSAPSSKIDGQEATVFGAISGHPTNLNNAVIATAQSYTSAFQVGMSRAWNYNCSAVIVTVNIQATANFTSTGSLVFRTVMVEKLIQFSVQPGTNGEKNFEDAAIKSFPTLQSGVSMAPTWTVGQTQTFTLNCVIPSYARKKSEIAFVGFIQDDGNKKVAQAYRLDKAALPSEGISVVNTKVDVTCTNSITPKITVINSGQNVITNLNITPYTDGVAASPINWTGNIGLGLSANISLSGVTSSTVAGNHTFSYNINYINTPATIFNQTTISNKASYLVATSSQTSPVAEGFLFGTYPPVGWSLSNPDAGASWVRVTNAGGFGLTSQSAKYDFYNNTAPGDVDELYLPPTNLAGDSDPDMTFDVAYVQRTATSDDKLEVFVSDNCGANWKSVYSASGVGLATVPSPQFSAFTPNPSDASHWRTEAISLVGFNKENVLVKFVTTSDHGNNLYLDNVNLWQSKPVGLSKPNTTSFSVNLFPNPTSGNAALKISSLSVGSAKVSVINMLGQVVYTKQTKLDTGVNTVSLDTKEFANGVYNVIVEGNQGTVIKKLNVIK